MITNHRRPPVQQGQGSIAVDRGVVLSTARTAPSITTSTTTRKGVESANTAIETGTATAAKTGTEKRTGIGRPAEAVAVATTAKSTDAAGGSGHTRGQRMRRK